MSGMLGKLKELLSISERTKPPEGNDRMCSNCMYWLPPSMLTEAMTKGKRALDWARQGGYGHCRAPRPIDNSADEKEAQRFTLGKARCSLWSWKRP